jgi:DNA-binding LytR/AlgR family response regulator
VNCLIIDDNAKTGEALSTLLKTSGAFVNIHHASQPYMVRSLITWEQPDMVFVRVRLWDYRVFKTISSDKMPVVVFLCGGKERITEKIETTVSYQLREPYTDESIKRLLRQVIFKPQNERPDFFFVRYEARFHKIVFSDVELVELMQGSYVKLHSKSGRFLLPGSISGFMEKLPPDLFIRISDGLIVPVRESQNVKDKVYEYKDKKYKLTFRFAAAAKQEIEDWVEA